MIGSYIIHILVRKLFPILSILARVGQKYTDMAINAMCKIHVTKAKNAKRDAFKDAKQAVDEGIKYHSTTARPYVIG
jgi:hypothetical protein